MVAPSGSWLRPVYDSPSTICSVEVGTRRRIPRIPGVLICVLAAASRSQAQQQTAVFSPQALAFFETRVRPILKANCEVCHNPANKSGGLSFDSRESVVKGGDDGPAVKPG